MPLKAPRRAPQSWLRQLPWMPLQAALDRPARSAYRQFRRGERRAQDAPGPQRLHATPEGRLPAFLSRHLSRLKKRVKHKHCSCVRAVRWRDILSQTVQHSSATELEHIIKLLGRSPRLYAPRARDANCWRRTTATLAYRTRSRWTEQPMLNRAGAFRRRHR